MKGPPSAGGNTCEMLTKEPPPAGESMGAIPHDALYSEYVMR